jgi:tripartite-type tricarboxylate transporter receptor subunit TctC
MTARSVEPLQYPARAVRFIVPLSPGGTVENLARTISARLFLVDRCTLHLTALRV